MMTKGFVSGASGATEDRQWLGIYDAQVAVATDPTAKGRVRLYVPQVLGNTYSAWAFPMQPGLMPAVGVSCFCMFLGGNPDLPYYFLGITGNVLQELTSNTGLVLNPNPYFTGNVITGYVGTNGAVVGNNPNQDTNPPYASAITWTATGTGGGFIAESENPIALQGSTPYQITAWVFYPVGGTINVGLGQQTAAHGALPDVTTTATVPPGAWTQVSVTVNTGGTAAFGWPIIGPATSTIGEIFSVEALQVIGSIPGSLITPNTVTIDQLASNIIYAGIINGTLVEAATLVGGTILSYGSQTPRGPYDESFEGSGSGGFTNGTWTISGATSTFDSTWASDGAWSLQLTASGTGVLNASSPMQATTPNDPVTVSIDINAPVFLFTNLFVQINWYDATHTIINSSTSPLGALTVANTPITIVVSDNAPAVVAGDSADAAFFTVEFGDSGSAQPISTILWGDNVMVSGNLAFAASPVGGTDGVGNIYDQGISIIGVSGLTNAFTVTDPFGNTIASINSVGQITAQSVATTNDIVVEGESLTDTLNALPLGIVARSFIPFASLPYPSTPFGATETALYELDCVLIAGRAYLIVLEMTDCLLSAFGRLDIRVHGTTDGTNPTTSSDIFMNAFVDVPYGNRLFASVPSMSRVFQPGINQTIKLLVTGACGSPSTTFGGGTGGTTPTAQIVSMSASGAFFINGQDGLSVIDMGVAVPNTGVLASGGGGGGGGATNHTTTYSCTETFSYFGTSVGGNRRNTNGLMYQGQYQGGSGNGSTTSYARFDNTSIWADLSGATINSFKITMTNQHSWFNSGMDLLVGTTSRSMPLGTPITAFSTNNQIHITDSFFAEGMTLTFDVTATSIPGNFKSGSATGLLFGNNSTTSLTDYGYFTGGPGSVKITVNYTK